MKKQKTLTRYEAKKFLWWLLTEYPCSKAPTMSIIASRPVIMNPKTRMSGFGTYSPGMMHMYIATAITSRREALRTIAHEYRHHMQNLEGSEFSERKAGAFMWRAVKKYLEDR